MFDFLTLRPDAFGLDISDLSFKVAKLKKKREELSLASFGEGALNPGVIDRGEIKDPKALAQAIKEALARVKGSKMDTKYAVCSLPEEKAFLQVIQLPKMSKEELKKAVYFEAENYVPLPLEKVYVDFEVAPPVVDNLDHTDVLLAAFPKESADSYIGCLKQAGLHPVALEIESLAISRSLIKNGFAANPVLILDLGAKRTGFMIFSGFSLRFTATIPVSSVGLSEVIARELKVDFEAAEKLKLDYGLSGRDNKRSRAVFDALVPQLTALIEEIKKYLEYYRSHTSHEHLSIDSQSIKLLLCGGGANLKGLDSFLASELKIKTELGNPWVNILKEPAAELPELSFAQSLGYTTALGLALRSIKPFASRRRYD